MNFLHSLFLGGELPVMVIGSFHVHTFLIPVIDSFKVVMTDRTIVLELFPRVPSEHNFTSGVTGGL